MQQFLIDKLSLSKEQAEYVINDRSDEDVIQTMLGWRFNNEAIDPLIGPDAYFAIVPSLHLEQYKIKIREWAIKWKQMKFYAEASLFELALVCDSNPFYLIGSFSTPIAACKDLRDTLKISVAPDAYKYGIVMDKLSHSVSVKVEDVHAIFKEENLPDVDKGVHLLKPFSAYVLFGHPLENVDIDDVPCADLAQYVTHNGDIIPRRREKMYTANQLDKEGEFYVEKVDVDGFCKLITSMNTPIW